jgi:hypothetical protein
MQALYNMFRVNPNAFPGVNPGAFSSVANEDIANETAAYKATSPEMQRQAAILEGQDVRAEAGIRGGLDEANQVRQTRNMGYGGSFPLREAQEDTRNARLRELLLPRELEARTAATQQQTEREFMADEGQRNRDARAQIAAAGQAGQTARAQLPLREKASSDSGWGNLFGLLGKKAAPVPTTQGGTVKMIDPADGEEMDVPLDQVEFAESQGAYRVR